MADNWVQPPRLPPDSNYWMNVMKFNYTWTIFNYRLYDEMGEALESQSFPNDDLEKMKWCLRVPPKGSNVESKLFFSPRLVLLACEKPEIDAYFRLSIVNDRQEPIYTKSLNGYHRFMRGGGLKLKKFVARNYILKEENGLLLNDQLQIFCEVRVVNKYGNIHMFGQMKVGEDLGNLFDNEKFSDFTLSGIGGREFRVHKVILAARSEVFAKIFEHDMEENNLSRYTITDIDPEILREMLYFIYTGTAPNLDEVADDLLIAADKYGLKDLKIMCEKTLIFNLSIETAAKTLIIADLYNAEELKGQTIRFISAQATNVIKTLGWQDMIKTYPHLLAEAFSSLAMQNSAPVELPLKRIKLH